jgi:hypothetical protein
MTTLVAILSITMYIPHSNDLFCGGLVSEQTTPWVAKPVSSDWKCGEKVGIWYTDGTIETYTVRDAGPFDKNCVMQPDGTCPLIAFDVPERWAPFGGMSTTARKVWSVTAIQEEFERRAGR